MIALIRGKLFAKRAGEIIVDTTGGVGYSLSVSMRTYEQLPEIDGEVLLHVHHAIREDSQQLFGFFEESELTLFRLLTSAQGVGGKSAMGILSAIEPNDLCKYIAQGDLAHLTKLPGIGKKTAERLIVELRDKVKKLMSSIDISSDGAENLTPAGEMSNPANLPNSGIFDETIQALISLGFAKATAEKAVEHVKADFLSGENQSIEHLIKLSLKRAVK